MTIEVLWQALIWLGIGCFLVGSVWSVIVASKIHALWSIGIMLLMIVVLPVFGIVHWRKAKKPFIVWLFGVFVLVGCVIFG